MTTIFRECEGDNIISRIQWTQKANRYVFADGYYARQRLPMSLTDAIGIYIPAKT